MNKVLLVLITIIAFGCKNYKTSSVQETPEEIVYMLPLGVENLCYTYIKKQKEDKFVFQLFRKEENYEVFVANASTFYGDRGNRKILIRKKLYPLFFDYDYDFGTVESYDTIMKKYKKPELLTRKVQIAIIEHGYWVTFDKKGTILKEFEE